MAVAPADTLTGVAGWAGKDTFVFGTRLGSTNIDHVTDFSALDDTIQHAKSVVAASTPDSSAFKDLGVTGAKIDAHERQTAWRCHAVGVAEASAGASAVRKSLFALRMASAQKRAETPPRMVRG